jgi:HSP20 family molecular chaperone IbpA
MSSSNRIPLKVSHDEFNAREPFRPTDNAFDMNAMGDETERIKTRMREFEERCRKWREEFFNRTNQPSNKFVSFDDQHDQRVPFENVPKFSSTMHKSFVDDLADGSKVYRIEFDIGDFNPNEVSINLNGRTLIVKGDRELKAGSAKETKTFNRELTLPEYVDCNKLKAFMLENEPNSVSQTQLVAQSSSNNILLVEAPVILDKYTYRRSTFDQPSTNQRVSSGYSSPVRTFKQTTSINPNGTTSTTESHHTENRTTTTSTTRTTSRTINDSDDNFRYRSPSLNRSVPNANNHEYIHTNNLIKNSYTSPSHLNLSMNQSIAPELIPGYPVYDSNEGCCVYKFDLSGFDQTDIHLTITVDRVLEIKACRETNDQLGKVYREFKREIVLEPEVDANLIKNLLHDGILTVKIPKQNSPNGIGSISNSHNLHTPNGFREIFNDDGKLAKLTADFRGFYPENLRIVLSANNVLKVSAQQIETHNGKNTVEKETTRQYTLPDWVSPDDMKAIMSRDGYLTIDFSGNNNQVKQATDERIKIN